MRKCSKLKRASLLARGYLHFYRIKGRRSHLRCDLKFLLLLPDHLNVDRINGSYERLQILIYFLFISKVHRLTTRVEFIPCNNFASIGLEDPRKGINQLCRLTLIFCYMYGGLIFLIC